MTDTLRKRFWIECALALASLVALALISSRWIETLTGLDPDSGSGAAEWAVVAGPSAITMVMVSLARAELTRGGRQSGMKRRIGVGDAIAAATSAVGVRPCGGCKRRQEALNRAFGPSSRPRQPRGVDPSPTPIRFAASLAVDVCALGVRRRVRA